MEENDTCKICFISKNTTENPLIKPCNCKSLVHKLCIEKWRRKNIGKIQYYKCEVCLHKYKISIFSNKHLFNGIRFIYFNLCNFTTFYFVFTTLLNFLLGYLFYSKGTIINKFTDNAILVSSYYTTGLIINLSFCLLVSTIFIISMTISNRKNLNWKDSDNIDVRILYFINFMNLIFLALKNILSIFAIFSLKITINYITEFCLKDIKEILDSDYNVTNNNLLNVFYCPEIVDNSNQHIVEDVSYYRMLNEL